MTEDGLAYKVQLFALTILVKNAGLKAASVSELWDWIDDPVFDRDMAVALYDAGVRIRLSALEEISED